MNVIPLKPVEATEPKSTSPAASTVSKKPRLPKPAPILDDNANVVGISDMADRVRCLMETMGSPNPCFAIEMVEQLGNIATKGPVFDKHKTNFALSVVAGIEPRDQVEAMLAAQMAAVHMATMTFARRLAHVETLPQLDANEKAFNKLARTFAVQVEALKRYRSKGEQRVIVERVTVNEGGQAIVGNVAHGEG